MNDRNQRIEDIFHAAMELADPLPRSEYLQRACAEDTAMLRHLEELIAGAAVGEAVLGSGSPFDQLSHGKESSSVRPGDSIGRYKLLEKIGEGGCGVVYMAEQEEPVRRRVALKLIRPGMDSREIIARFESERQALALMDHPNIAKVFDGGVCGSRTELPDFQSQIPSGRPYFVMELVRGVRLTDYCEHHALDTRQRLDLFLQVCSAVQHAHQKGIIHRDLKPANILVTEIDGRPVPKVIDFGIARATEQKPTEKTLFTQFAQFLGTPAYMSPEQAAMNGTDVDTRSDIYSLGVLLYQLLTGTTPFDAQQLLEAGFDEMRRIIRETDPPKPSTRLTQTGRGTAVANLSASDVAGPGSGIGGPQAVTGERRSGGNPESKAENQKPDIDPDLDWIVMKCLEKDRSRRYETASGLAADIRRHLNDEPVSAAAPSPCYRFRKFVRRNRGLVMASSAVFIASAAGLTGTIIGLTREARQRAEAERQAAHARRQAAIAEAIGKFQAGMLAGADPGRLLGDKVTVLQVAEAAARELDAGKLADQPLVEAGVRQTIGLTFRAIGRYDLAEPNLHRSLELTRRELPPEDPAVAQSLNALGLLWLDSGRAAQAEPHFREALAVCRESLPEDHPHLAQAVNNLALALQSLGRYDEAGALFREACALRRRHLPPDHPDVALGLHNLAMLLRETGSFSEAEALAREALGIRRRSLPAGHPDIAQSLNGLALLLHNRGDEAQAESLAREALDICRHSLPAAHSYTAQTLNNLGLVLQSLGKIGDAEPLFQEAVAMRRKLLPAGHPEVALGLHNLAVLLRARAQIAEAEALCREALDIRRTALPAAHPDLSQSLNLLALLLCDQQRPDEAEPHARQAVEISRAVLPDPHPHLAACLNNLAWVLQTKGNADAAEPIFRESLEMRRRTLPAAHPDLLQGLINLANVLAALHRPAEAEPILREALAATESTYGTRAWQSAFIQMRLGNALRALNRFEDAESSLVDAERVLAGAAEAPPGQHQACLASLIELYDDWSAADPGRGHAAQAAEWRAKLQAGATTAPR